jgi:hypothetical protein
VKVNPKHDPYWPNSKSWEQKAEEARTTAAGFIDPEAKAALLNVAAIYDGMAKRATAREEDGSN